MDESGLTRAEYREAQKACPHSSDPAVPCQKCTNKIITERGDSIESDRARGALNSFLEAFALES